MLIYKRMDPNPNKYKNIEESKSLISQTEKNDNNNDINQNPNIKITKSKQKEKYINKKRKEPMEEKNEENLNILKESEIPEVLHKSFSSIKHVIEEKKEAKIKLQKELDELNAEIDKYEKIQNLYLEMLNILHNNEISNEGKDQTKIIINKNKGDLLSLDQNSKQPVNPDNFLDEFLNIKTVIETIISKNENQNADNKCLNVVEESQNCINTSMVFEVLTKKKCLNVETINNNIKENENNINNSNIYQEYSFRCLTDNLNYKIRKGTRDSSIKIELENNGKSRWPENEIFLLADEANSTIERKKIIRLCPLNPKEKSSVNIQFNLDGLKLGIYKNCLSFYAKGKKIGNNISINIEIY